MNLLVDALAAFRLTRLVTEDQITKRARTKIAASGPEKLAILTECPWCAGFWISCGVIAARRVVPTLWEPVAEILAVSAVTGLIAENLG